jgi:hypothetical protein
MSGAYKPSRFGEPILLLSSDSCCRPSLHGRYLHLLLCLIGTNGIAEYLATCNSNAATTDAILISGRGRLPQIVSAYDTELATLAPTHHQASALLVLPERAEHE